MANYFNLRKFATGDGAYEDRQIRLDERAREEGLQEIEFRKGLSREERAKWQELEQDSDAAIAALNAIIGILHRLPINSLPPSESLMLNFNKAALRIKKLINVAKTDDSSNDGILRHTFYGLETAMNTIEHGLTEPEFDHAKDKIYNLLEEFSNHVVFD